MRETPWEQIHFHANCAEIAPGFMVRIAAGGNQDSDATLELIRDSRLCPPEGAEDNGVGVRFGGENDLVRLPGEWVIDEAATAELRKKR